MSFISTTADVSKLDKSNENKEEHPSKVSSIYWTFFVMKLRKLTVLKEEQNLNIPPICSSEEELKCEKSA